MINALKEKSESFNVRIALPVRRVSALSHTRNVEYCIQQLLAHAIDMKNPVVGYLEERALGTRHMDHRVLPQEMAAELKRANHRFDYITLEELTRRREDIHDGKYQTERGLIVGLNSDYMPSKKPYHSRK